MKLLRSSWFPVLLGIIFLVAFLSQSLSHSSDEKTSIADHKEMQWHSPDINLVPHSAEGEQIRYGRELIVNTAAYFGPKGKVSAITNGMSCQNCHVMAGTKFFGNNFSAVAANYPRFRERSGREESIAFRINDCMQRSLNGQAIDSQGKEMKAMLAYFLWIGKDIAKGEKPEGSGIVEIPFMNRASDPQKGRNVFQNKCSRCHGDNGEGILYPDSTRYLYPPVWGNHSYNVSAGLYRISRLAAFIKYNMPFDQVATSPLGDEEAWDVAAFINSQPRPAKRFSYDWPRLESKPVDYPFGPYADHFTEQQHKYGPFIPIKTEKERSAVNSR